MISCIEDINSIALNELVGATCFVKDYNGECKECLITRIDMFISKHGIGVKAHLKGLKKETINYPQCVTLENYNYDVSCSPIGFLTPMSYAKFYSELG